MSRLSLTTRYILFCLFFFAGAGAITLSILAEPEMSIYFQNQQLLEKIQRENEKIEDLTEQYQAQIDLIQTEPNVLARLERITFGSTFTTRDEQAPALPTDNAVLRQAAQSVLAELRNNPPEPALPDWFERCRRPNTRLALFIAGAGLVLITFLFFGSPGSQNQTPPTIRNNVMNCEDS